MAASMDTKADLQNLTTTIQDALWVEMAGLRTEVAMQAGRIQIQEHSAVAQSARITASDKAVSRQ
ncbi:Hypothetical predicted protein, partial [Pelobates cultripes]